MGMRIRRLWVGMVCSCVCLAFLSGSVHAAELITSSGLLWLVNRDNRLEQSFVPTGLTKINGYSLRPEAAAAFEAMLTDMQELGIVDLRIQSAYRSYAYQQTLFNNKKVRLLALGYDEKTAEETASRSTAFPGASEHQTGLAIDVTVNGSLTRAFADTDAGQWIQENCDRYGFIIRYPEDKIETTGIIYEPWHLRYVGIPHAPFMKEKGFCYEEYIDYLKETLHYIYWFEDGYYLVRYSPEPPLDMPQSTVDFSYLSPDKSDGCVITVKRGFVPGFEVYRRSVSQP